MLEAIGSALAAALLAVALGLAANFLKVGRRASPLNLAALALIVAGCVLGAKLGGANGHNTTGAAIGAVAGLIGARLIRQAAA